ncbi:hypothetical protein RND81_09G066500 [Saponaria officinalis]|uniref:Bifunctional inhibitor/plant lipid transfer protein/seed storage helical domain-containing protein n=1 Tax=Saponaria officinalis TaxID=3572 RepID=A0AAW1IJJ8_SAPOF
MNMGSTMVVGIILLLSLHINPAFAQEAAPCWTEIATCLEEAKAQNYPEPLVLLCCPSISAAVTGDLACFCLGKPDIVSQDATALFDNILEICNIPDTLDTLCPDTLAPEPSIAPTEA